MQAARRRDYVASNEAFNETFNENVSVKFAVVEISWTLIVILKYNGQFRIIVLSSIIYYIL